MAEDFLPKASLKDTSLIPQDSDVESFDEASLDVVLPAKQYLFIQEYLIDCNASQAALRAGYRPSHGSVLLQEPIIAARIRMAQAQRVTRTQITQDQVLHEMSLLANSRLDWFYITDTGELQLTAKAPEGAMGAVQSMKRKCTVHPPRGDSPGYTVYDVEIRLWDKPNPLKLMGRHVGLFAERLEHTGPNGGPIETVSRIERVIVDTKGAE